MKLISIGFGSTVCAERVLAVIAPESAPIKRLIQEARERGMLIDASFGRKTKSVLLMDTEHVLLSSVSPEILSARMEEKPEPAADQRPDFEKIERLLSQDFQTIYDSLGREEKRTLWRSVISEIRINNDQQITGISFL